MTGFRWLWARCRRPWPQKFCLIYLELFWRELHVGVPGSPGQPNLVQYALEEHVFVLGDGHGSIAQFLIVALVLQIAVIVTVGQCVQLGHSPLPRSDIHVIEIKLVRVEILSAIKISIKRRI